MDFRKFEISFVVFVGDVLLDLGPFESVEVSYFFEGVRVLLEDEPLLCGVERCLGLSELVEVLLVLVSSLRVLSAASVVLVVDSIEDLAAVITREISNFTWRMSH